MAGIIFALTISMGIPLMSLVYSFYKKRYIPFVLGVLAFVVSQVLIRIPILQYLGENSTAYLMFHAMQPVLFAIVIGLSAGIVEELARFIAMYFFMRQRDWQSGFWFGVGHGGIEAVLFVGIRAINLLFLPTAIVYSTDFFISGTERFFAMLLHIGLSIIVLQGVVRKKFIYIFLAIIIHGIVDALIGIIPLYVPQDSVLIVLEVTIAIIALAVFNYSLWIKRRGEVL
ncbi:MULTISPECIES: YhfC family glutamic-type intramembrane protease [Bacillaceae]|uniref:YhfC family glutamic-type intramembrane protease n=1 Tax=Bacillaceae TaxID=186817 RepID=UPI0006227A02|nr:MULTISPECIES: YhfC family glutamic-type intramembrane protease [Bacillaceae]KKE78539.1 CAAX protease [Bacilli bacterium VT-13-104]PZD85760.1 YhfC family intramembrane metalloprotease [Bacilli bacterium]MED4473174.1 YhfC family glutamic-type intramembrane protease [Oceanobacillus caeni]PZD87475.1 YhfC family intramembrane metalloprotease [Bacilli bacterium]PZD90803.1 YhfC family intramembrane metalloprotease [Bacilli bacterium]